MDQGRGRAQQGPTFRFHDNVKRSLWIIGYGVSVEVLPFARGLKMDPFKAEIMVSILKYAPSPVPG